ncbi:hypothetical protein [Melghirimyces thermohalophilus]|uniref:hypothetical protein n=1 Tax=Melghirimyces thermohalophilus TaxID=1236220 RepID=UPI0015A3E80C|nr:hypothetical protein [Melghirimyces thermohalophilus]
MDRLKQGITRLVVKRQDCSGIKLQLTRWRGIDGSADTSRLGTGAVGPEHKRTG